MAMYCCVLQWCDMLQHDSGAAQYFAAPWTSTVVAVAVAVFWRFLVLKLDLLECRTPTVCCTIATHRNTKQHKAPSVRGCTKLLEWYACEVIYTWHIHIRRIHVYSTVPGDRNHCFWPSQRVSKHTLMKPAPSLPVLFLLTIKKLPPQPASFYKPPRNQRKS